jgi:hypothetical protein
MHARYLLAARLGALIFAMALFVAAAGCDGDDEDATTPSAAETATTEPADGTPASQDDATPASGGSTVNGVIVYVTGTGLDGQRFEAAQPINCSAYLDADTDPLTVERAQGKVCIDFTRSAFAGTEGVMEVMVVGTDDRWDLTLELQDFSWVVTGAARPGE